MTSHNFDIVNLLKYTVINLIMIKFLETYKQINKILFKEKLMLIDVPEKVAVFDNKKIHGF